MSHKFVGPVGKQFRGDKQRAMLLMGSARLLAQRGLDKIEARGGNGFQLERQILGDGSTVEAWVNKLAGQSPQVRVKIWCPEPETGCAPQLIDASMDSLGVMRYITWEGMSKVFDPAYGMPQKYWVGKRGTQPIILVLYNWRVYVGDTTIAWPDIQADAVCLKKFENKEYVLTAKHKIFGEKHNEVWIYGDEIKADGSFPDSVLLWKVLLPSTSPFSYLNHFFQFSASSTKLVSYAAAFMPTAEMVAEILLPAEFPPLDGDGDPVPFYIDATQVYERDYSELLAPTDNTVEITAPPNDFANYPEEYPGQYYDRSFLRTITYDHTSTSCVGAHYDEDVLKLVTLDQHVQFEQIITQYSWEYSAGTEVPINSEIEWGSPIGPYYVGSASSLEITDVVTAQATFTVRYGGEIKESSDKSVVAFDKYYFREDNNDMRTAIATNARFAGNPYYDYVWGYLPEDSPVTKAENHEADDYFNSNNLHTYFALVFGTSGIGINASITGPTWREQEHVSSTEDWNIWADIPIEEHLTLESNQGQIYHYGVELATEVPRNDLASNVDGVPYGFYPSPTIQVFDTNNSYKGQDPYTTTCSDIKWHTWVPGKIPPDVVSRVTGTYIPNRKINDAMLELWPATTCWPDFKPLL